MATKRKNSRDKGGRGERQAGKEFHDWWGTDFSRTPGSGAFATRQKDPHAWSASGDIVTPDKEFPFCIEVKWVEGWSMEQLLRNDGCIIYDWWRQAIGECPPEMLPILVFKKNQHPFYCMIESDHMADTQFLADNEIRYFTLPLTKDITGVKPMQVHIMLLSDFFKLDPEIWKKQKAHLVETRQTHLAYPS